MLYRHDLQNRFIRSNYFLKIALVYLLVSLISSCHGNKSVHLTGNFPDLPGAEIFCISLHLKQPLENGKLDVWLDDVEPSEYYFGISYPLKTTILNYYRGSDGKIKPGKGFASVVVLSTITYLNPEQSQDYILQPVKGITAAKIVNYKRYDNYRSNLFGLEVVSKSQDNTLYRELAQLNKNFTYYNRIHIMDSLYQHSNAPGKILSEFDLPAIKLNRQYNTAALLKAKRDFAMKHPESPIAALAILDVDSLNLSGNLYAYQQVLDKMTGRAVESDYFKSMKMKIDTRNGVHINEGDFFALPSGKTPGSAPFAFKIPDHKYTLVEFWASWCASCRAQNLQWNIIMDEYKNKGFTVLGVSLDQFSAEWKEAIKKDKLIDWIHISDLQNAWNSANAIRYGIQSIPFNLLINSQGRVERKNIKPAELKEFLIKNIH
jgi:thiol-disulfide isomerase/thioredoxin